MRNILISACLFGVKCRYDGTGTTIKEIEQLKKKYNLIPFCPEIAGGLSTPRPAVELCEGKALAKDKKDFSEEFIKGGEYMLKSAVAFDCPFAILKSRSPSCGKGIIHDGCFTGKLVDGNGISAQLLIDNGIKVFTEEEVSLIFEVFKEAT